MGGKKNFHKNLSEGWFSSVKKVSPHSREVKKYVSGYGHVGYQSFSENLINRFSKSSPLYDFSEPKKVSKCLVKIG